MAAFWLSVSSLCDSRKCPEWTSTKEIQDKEKMAFKSCKQSKNAAQGNLFKSNGMGEWRCCQTNANWSLQGQRGCPLCRAETAPLSESGGAVEFEIVA